MSPHIEKKRIFFKCQDLSFPYDFLNGRGEKVLLQATSRLQLLFPPLLAVRLSGVLGVEAWRLYPSVVLRASYDIKKNESAQRTDFGTQNGALSFDTCVDMFFNSEL